MSRATPGEIRLAVKAGRDDAGKALKRLISLGVFDSSRKVIKRQSHVEIPVVESVSGCEIVMQEDPAFYRKVPDLAKALQGKIPDQFMDLIPRGFSRSPLPPACT